MDTKFLEARIASVMSGYKQVTQAETILKDTHYAILITGSTYSVSGDTILSIEIQGIGDAPSASIDGDLEENLAITSDIAREFSSDSDQDQIWSISFDVINPIN